MKNYFFEIDHSTNFIKLYFRKDVCLKANEIQLGQVLQPNHTSNETNDLLRVLSHEEVIIIGHL